MNLPLTGAGRPWEPGDIESLQYRWSAQYGLPGGDGQACGTWLARNGGVTLLQVVGANQPVLDVDGIGGQPSLAFDQTDYLPESGPGAVMAGWDYDQPWSFACVSRSLSSGATSRTLFAKADGSGPDFKGIVIYANSLLLKVALINDYAANVAIEVPEASNHALVNVVYVFTYDGSGDAAGVTIRRSGADVTGTPTKDGLAGNSIVYADSFCLGAYHGGQFPWNGRLADWCAFNEVLSAANVARVEAFYSGLFGVAI